MFEHLNDQIFYRVGFNEFPGIFSLIDNNSDSHTFEGLLLRTFTGSIKISKLRQNVFKFILI